MDPEMLESECLSPIRIPDVKEKINKNCCLKETFLEISTYVVVVCVWLEDKFGTQKSKGSKSKNFVKSTSFAT